MYSTLEIDGVARLGGCRFVYPRLGREDDTPVSGSLGHVVTWSARASGAVAAFREREGMWHLESQTPRGHAFCEALIAARLGV